MTTTEILELIQKNIDDGNLPGAESRCREALRDAPNEKLLLMALADVLSAQGQHQAAAAELETAHALYPGSRGIETSLVRALMASGQFARAIPILESIVKRKPSISFLDHLATAYTYEKREADAERIFEQMLARDPSNLKLRLRYARYAIQTRNMLLAERQLGAAIALGPSYAEPHFLLGNVLEQIERTDEAMLCYQNAAALDPQHAEAFYRLSQLLFHRSENDAGLTALQSAIAAAADPAPYQLILAQIYKRAELHDTALNEVEAVLAKNPDNPEAQHLHAAWSGHAKTAADPRYVTQLFDFYAATFDQHLAGTLGYGGPEKMVEMLKAAVPDRIAFELLLDIGCGTGLGLSALLKSYKFKRAVGIDLSQGMLDKAAEKKIYTQLIKASGEDALRDFIGQADLIVALEVFVYLGDLDRILAITSGALRPGGYFVCSIEAMKEGTYQLQQNARFAHSPGYVEITATRYGLSVMRGEAVNLRRNNENDAEGYMWVFQKD